MSREARPSPTAADARSRLQLQWLRNRASPPLVGMEIVGAGADAQVDGRWLRALGQNIVLNDAEHACGPKLAGCQATLLSKLLVELMNIDLICGVSGIFTASDGAKTDAVDACELGLGLVVHSDASGQELPKSLGGPLRIIFPCDVAVQAAICGTPKPVNLKMCVRLDLLPVYAVTDMALERALAASASRIVSHMNGDHLDSLAAYAAAHALANAATCGYAHGDVLGCKMLGLDTRGFTLRVHVRAAIAPLTVLIPYPQKLVKAAEVRKLAVTMHHEAYAALGFGYRLRAGYYASMARHVVGGIRKAVLTKTSLPKRVLTGGGAVALAVAVGALALVAQRRRLA